MKITLTKPKRAWPYFVLAGIILADDSMRLALVKGWPSFAALYVFAVSFAKWTMAGFIYDYGFRTSIDEWRKKCKREEDRSHTRFVRAMDEADARWREWNRDHNAGEEWKRGGET